MLYNLLDMEKLDNDCNYDKAKSRRNINFLNDARNY
jgi:hypothetical protein